MRILGLRLLTFPLLTFVFAGLAFAQAPDLAITSSDIIFSDTTLEPSQVITVTATINNLGGQYGDPTAVLTHDTAIGTSSNGTYVYNSFWPAEYFVAEGNYYINAISLRIRNIGDTSDAITVEIRKGKLNDLSASTQPNDLIASTTLISTHTTYSWQEFAFDNPSQLIRGATYWICLENQTTNPANSYGLWFDSGTPKDKLGGSDDQGVEWKTTTLVAGNISAYYKVYKCTDTIVSCFQGNPGNGGLLLGTTVFSTPVAAGGSKTVSFDWSVANGETDIYFTVDYPNPGIIAESSETNNIAYKTITGVATIPRITGAVEPEENATGVTVATPVRAAFSEAMSSSTVLQSVSVKVLTDNNGNVPADTTVTGTAGYSNQTLTFSTQWKKGYTYQITISTSAQDLYGNAIASPKVWTFTTLMDASAENTITAGDSATKVTLDAGVSDEDYYIVIDTTVTSDASLSGKINRANGKIEKIRGNFSSPIGGTVRRFTMYKGAWPGTANSGNFTQGQARIVIAYTPAADGLVLDDKGVLVKESSLRLYWLDESRDLWVRIPGAALDSDNNTVTGEVNHFSVYALFGAPDTDLSEAYAYPVPWKPFDGNAATGTESGGITFTGIGSKATIRVYTLSGELVKILDYQYSGGAEQQKWDGTNTSDEKVASGVYLYHIENEKEHTSGKLIIVK